MLVMIHEDVKWRPDLTIPVREQYVNKELSWCSGDTKKNYDENGNHDYSPESIIYKFNSLGYRCPEFSTSGPKLLSVGCSTVFGTGLPQREMMCEIVAQELGVINLNFGQPGGSNDYISRILNVAIPLIEPDYVVVNFTYIQRREFITHSGEFVVYHPGMVDRRSNSSEQRYCSRMLRDLGNVNEDLSNLYKNYCLVEKILAGRKWVFSAVGGYFPKFLHNAYKKSCYVGHLVDHGPKARDGIHAGREANADMALTYLRGLA